MKHNSHYGTLLI